MNHDLLIVKDKEKGRCVIANRDFRSGELIEENHVVTVDYDKVKDSEIEPYCIDWYGSDAIAFGNISLINHSSRFPNARIENDPRHLVMRCYAIRDVQKGEEITYSYRCKLWFDEV
jgi:hypothetical protein